MKHPCHAGAAIAVVALIACAPPSYRGGARSIEQRELARSWTTTGRPLPPRPQRAERDCGAAVTASLLAYWGVPVSLSEVDRELRASDEDGVLAGDLRDFLRRRGVRAYLIAGTIDDLVHEIERGRPVIVGLIKPYGEREGLRHYEVVVAVRDGGAEVASYDPAGGWRRYSRDDLLAEWDPGGRVAVVVLPPGRAR